MSNQDQVSRERGNLLANGTVTELEELLKTAAQDIPLDETYLDALEAAILQRETECPTGRLSDPNKAWERFQKSYLSGNTSQRELVNEADALKTVIFTGSKHKPHRLRRVLLIAAVIVIMMALLLPSALSFWNIFHVAVHWENEQFSFVPSTKKDTPDSESNIEPHSEISLEQSLAEHNLPTSFAPKWFPEDRHLAEVSFREIKTGNRLFSAVFADENDEHIIRFRLNEYSFPNAAKWEVNDENEIKFIYSDIIHYITTNNGCVGVHWYVDQYEASISGDITMDEAKAIIKSIYKG